jgi:hypothetical protein
MLLQVLEQLVSKLLQHMPLLQRTLDNMALLDVLLSFFQAVTGTYVRICRSAGHLPSCVQQDSCTYFSWIATSGLQ